MELYCIVLKFLLIYGFICGYIDLKYTADLCIDKVVKGKGKVTPLQAGVAQRVGRGIALLFHDHSTRRR